MKYYFAVIIAVLIVVIFLLFFILYKIYKLHVRATNELLEQGEQEELLSETSKGSTDISFVSDESRPGDWLDALHAKQDVDVTTVQPEIKELSESSNSLEKLYKQELRKQSLRNRPHLKMLLQYDRHRSMLKVMVKHIEGKIKKEIGSSETYIDIQTSPYRFRTYRNPGYRRPAKTIFKKTVELPLDYFELKTTYLLLFLLRYDPFSRLKVDGEVVVKLSGILTQGFVEGCQLEFSREIMKSNQEFTAFFKLP